MIIELQLEADVTVRYKLHLKQHTHHILREKKGDRKTENIRKVALQPEEINTSGFR